MSKQIHVGNVAVGGGALVSVQSMTNSKTSDVKATVDQIQKLANAGCDIVRVGIVDTESATAISKIKDEINVPLVGDIHFDYKLALLSIEHGIDGLRINPGNVGARWKIKEIAKLALSNKIPIRVGVNSGSIEKELLKKYNGPTVEAMVESALRNVRILEEFNFDLIKISVKSSSVSNTVKAYRELATKSDYPLHLGVTEAGPKSSGTIKSAIAIGALLLDGIGDTIRVSLTADPIEEPKVALDILRYIGYRASGAELISCPTCARSESDVIGIVNELEDEIKDIQDKVTIAVMGCEVNGPGEAKEADIGIAGTKNGAVIFKNGTIIRHVEKDKIKSAILDEVRNLK